MAAHSRTRPRSRRTKTKRVRYTYDSDTASETESAQHARPSRRSQRIQSYIEDSDDSVSDLESLSTELDPSQPVAPRRKPYRAPPTRSKTTNKRTRNNPTKPAKQHFRLFKRRKPNSVRSPHKRFSQELPSSAKIPPWQELPYQVLQQIMKYASYPFYEKASRTTSSIDWLCGVSLLCRSFHEACVAALLHSPPLYPSFRALDLLSLLNQDQEKTITNYRTKIKCLDIEVKHLLLRKSGLDIKELLDFTPLLERLRLYHNHDDFGTLVWAQPSEDRGRRWAYPLDLFDKLDSINVQLKSFEWNGRFPSGKQVLETSANVHIRPSFSQLQELSFLNITLPEKASLEETTLSNTLLISALDRLPSLKSLTFRNCSILNSTTMASFPTSLSSLEITNCQYFTSELLSIALSAGSCLKTLVLAGNQSMSLAFMTNLSTLCPRLQHLKLDLTYTDPSSYADRDPLYDEALPNGPPTWPSSLVSVEIENLRQLSSSEAEEVLASLVDSATDLPCLRRLVIKAIIKDASWRDRAELRKKWIPTLEDMFLDRSQPEFVPSIRKAPSKPLPKDTNQDKGQPTPKPELDEDRKPAGRQSTRIAHLKELRPSHSFSQSQDSQASDPNDSFADSYVSIRKLSKQAHSGRPEAQGSEGPFRQGKCNVVELILSDQRPAQDQYHEGDFLDSEMSGDEEWKGRDLDFD